MGAFARYLLGWLDRCRLYQPGDAFSQQAWKNFAGRADTRRAIEPGLWRHRAEKQKEPGLVSRRGTLARWEIARFQTWHRNVAGKVSRVRHSRFHSRDTRSSDPGKVS